MGWAVLYVAFGLVAFWLLGEVLLQYKARLRWRLLAFTGFLGVVLGVLLPSLPLIALGATGFAIGQTLVTLSYRKGFSTGWALGGRPGTSRRRRGEVRPMPPVDEEAPPGAADGPDAMPVPPDGRDADAPGPDGGGPGGYRDEGYQQPYREPYQEPFQDDYAATPAGGWPTVTGTGSGREYDTGEHGYATPEWGPETPAPAYATDGGGYSSYEATAYQDPYPAGYPGGGQQGYGSYPDPYPGGPGGDRAYPEYGGQGYPEQGYGAQAPDGYPPPAQPAAYDPYAAGEGYDTGGGQWAVAAGPSYYQETPPGGVWVPQQRDPAMPDGYPQAGPDPYATGYYQQNR
ncbi:hypothetical protein [Streptomyces aidingensis]|uniref:Uncharacterized protein n=1 Tax=Streptomyces aidingensis TaxID=910347 RepID=A0A1I1LQD3_9ACTN|nr:hypothetical protein [Streptomyces aidingensis]SFC73148.1 hypothetical protein SAMN05421773_105260 [Streptomyces aidingensis]